MSFERSFQKLAVACNGCKATDGSDTVSVRLLKHVFLFSLEPYIVMPTLVALSGFIQSSTVIRRSVIGTEKSGLESTKTNAFVYLPRANTRRWDESRRQKLSNASLSNARPCRDLLSI